MDLTKLSEYIDIDAASGAYKFKDIERICDTAEEYGCRSVVVSPCYLGVCLKYLAGRPNIIKKTLISAPYGADMTSVKTYAASQAQIMGAQTVEVAFNTGAFMSGNAKYAQHELNAVAGNLDVLFTAVIETAGMPVKTAAEAIDLAASVTPFVKVGSGYFYDPALAEKIAAGRDAAKGCVQITAAGRVGSAEKLKELIDAGAEYFSIASDNAMSLFNELEIGETTEKDT